MVVAVFAVRLLVVIVWAAPVLDAALEMADEQLSLLYRVTEEVSLMVNCTSAVSEVPGLDVVTLTLLSDGAVPSWVYEPMDVHDDALLAASTAFAKMVTVEFAVMELVFKV